VLVRATIIGDAAHPTATTVIAQDVHLALIPVFLDRPPVHTVTVKGTALTNTPHEEVEVVLLTRIADDGTLEAEIVTQLAVSIRGLDLMNQTIMDAAIAEARSVGAVIMMT
jgi:hypothetical protein